MLIFSGLQFAVDVVENTTAFADIDGHLAPIQFPACVDVPFKSTAYYECLARHVTVTAYKYSGTAPIGRDDGTDVDAVVDTRLRWARLKIFVFVVQKSYIFFHNVNRTVYEPLTKYKIFNT